MNIVICLFLSAVPRRERNKKHALSRRDPQVLHHWLVLRFSAVLLSPESPEIRTQEKQEKVLSHLRSKSHSQ